MDIQRQATIRVHCERAYRKHTLTVIGKFGFCFRTSTVLVTVFPTKTPGVSVANLQSDLQNYGAESNMGVLRVSGIKT